MLSSLITDRSKKLKNTHLVNISNKHINTIRKLLFILTCFLFLLQASQVLSATYYIDYNATNDSANGTAVLTPWKRSPGMVGFAGIYSHSAGDIFVFKGGVSWPAAVLPLTIGYSGSDGNIDTYMGGQKCGQPGSVSCNGGSAWGAGYPVFNGGMSLGANSAGIFSTGKSYLMFDGLKILDIGDDATGSGTAINVFHGSSIEVKNSWLQPEGIQAFSYNNGTGTKSKIYFHDNHISRAGRAVIYGETGAIVDDVRIYNNVFEGAGNTQLGTYHLDGFMMGNPATAECTSTATATVTNILFYNNYFYGDWHAGATAQYYSNGCTDTTTIYNNVFAYENLTCDMAAGTKCFSPGLVVIYNKDKNIKIYNNTFSNDGFPGYGNGSGTAITVAYLISPGNVYIKGNIFSRFGNVIQYQNASTIEIDYNLYFGSGGETHRLIWNTTPGDTWECATLAACQSHGFEAHAPAMADPKFVAIPNGTLGSGNWRIKSNSPAKDAFPTASAPTDKFTTDITGISRSQSGAWDIGAYESSPLPPSGSSPLPPLNLRVN